MKNINKRKTIFVYSYASKTRTNIDIYHRLSKLGWKIVLFTDIKKFGDKNKKYGLVEIRNTRIFFNHPRLHFPIKFILNIILFKPKFIYLEQDIISINVLILWFISKFINSNIVLQTYENISPLVKLKESKSLIKKLFYFLQYLLLRSLFFVPRFIFTVSLDSFRIFQRYGYNARLIPLGVNSSHFRHLNLSRLSIIKKFCPNLKKQSLRILDSENSIIYSYIGRLVKEKGIHFLLESFANLPFENKILLIDTFDSKTLYGQYLQKLIIKFKINKKIIFFKSNHYSINLIYNISDYVILPSLSNINWSEQYGRVPVEASFCSVMPVVSNSGHLNYLPISKVIYDSKKELPPLNLTKKINYTSKMLSTKEMANNINLILNSIL